MLTRRTCSCRRSTDQSLSDRVRGLRRCRQLVILRRLRFGHHQASAVLGSPDSIRDKICVTSFIATAPTRTAIPRLYRHPRPPAERRVEEAIAPHFRDVMLYDHVSESFLSWHSLPNPRQTSVHLATVFLYSCRKSKCHQLSKDKLLGVSAKVPTNRHHLARFAMDHCKRCVAENQPIGASTSAEMAMRFACEKRGHPSMTHRKSDSYCASVKMLEGSRGSGTFNPAGRGFESRRAHSDFFRDYWKRHARLRRNGMNAIPHTIRRQAEASGTVTSFSLLPPASAARRIAKVGPPKGDVMLVDNAIAIAVSPEARCCRGAIRLNPHDKISGVDGAVTIEVTGQHRTISDDADRLVRCSKDPKLELQVLRARRVERRSQDQIRRQAEV